MLVSLRNAVRRFVLLIGSIFLLVSLTPINVWYSQWLAGPWNDPRGDTLIVLGGSVLEDGMLGTSSYWRAVYAARIWRQGGFRQIVLSGANPPHPPVSAAMKQFLVAAGVPPEAIRLESESTSTRENAVAVKRMLQYDTSRKVLLTSDYHMFRAYRTFRKEGLVVDPRPFPDAIKQAGCISCRWPVFVSLLMETGSIIYYLGRGWI